MTDRLLICFAVALLFAVPILATGCGERSAAAPEHADRGQGGPLRVVATIRPLELIARHLVADLDEPIQIDTLMATDVSPHGFEPTASQISRLHGADVVIYNGFGLDDWAVRDLPRGAVAICFADIADLDHDHHHHDHEHGEACDHGPIDEHFWLDPELVSAFAAKIAVDLSGLLSDDDRQQLLDARQQFSLDVLEVDREAAAALSEFAGRGLVTHHNVFGRIAERYGLGEPVVLRPLAVVEPTARDLRSAIDTIREEDIRAILVEPQFSADAAKRIREATGVRIVEVDPLGGGAESWPELMRGIIDAIAATFAPADELASR